jgi:hypothetical protein
MKRFDSVAIAFLFLMPALAGCLENEGTDGISVNDITVNPGTMIAGEFQPLVITAIIVPGFTVISFTEIPSVPSFSRQPAKAGIKNRNAIATESKRFIISPEEQ